MEFIEYPNFTKNSYLFGSDEEFLESRSKRAISKTVGEELIESIRHAGAVRRGEAKPSRAWRFTKQADGTMKRELIDPELYRREQAAKWQARSDATAARAALSMSQSEFAKMLGISVRTLHHWEQGRRQPTGAARVLLRLARMEPKMFRRVLKAS